MKTLPSDFLLATTLRAIGDGVISCNADGHIVMMNDVAQQLTAWSEAEARGRLLKEVFVILNETTRQPTEDPVDKVLRLGRVVGLANHTLLLRRDGSEVAIDDSAAPIYDAEGVLRGVVLVFRDVSERRSAEWHLEMLAESGRALGEARHAAEIVDRVSEAVSRHFADFCVFDLIVGEEEVDRGVGRHQNPSFQPVADELATFPIPSSSDPDAPSHLIRRVLATREPCLLPTVTVEGLDQLANGPEQRRYFRERLKPRSVLSVPLLAGDKILGALTFFRHTIGATYTELDVKPAAELGHRIGLAMHYTHIREELRTQRARLDAIVKALPIGIVVAEISGRIVEANEEVSRIFRHPAHFSKSVSDYADYVSFHPDGTQVKGEEYPLGRAIAEQRVIRGERYHYRRGDGTMAWVSLSAAPVKLEDGTVLGGVVAVSDIDELVTAQEQTRAEQQRAERSDQRVRLLLERASVGIAIGDLGGRLSYANDVLLRWIGYTAEEMRAGEVRWDRLTPPEFAASDQKAVEELRSFGRAEPYEKAYVAKDGTPVPLLVGAVVLPAESEHNPRGEVAIFFTDLRRQKRAEAALLQTEKLAAVGRLASTISHEINNPLEAVTNLLYLLGTDPELSIASRDYLDLAERELARVTQIISQTLRFHRQSTSATQGSPQVLLDEVLSLYKSRLANSAIAIHSEYGEGVRVPSFEGDIRQVLSNLVGNAFDAMRAGGTLRLRTRYATRWRTGEPGVAIVVADTGGGMPASVSARIFEAFYSTKGLQGTGLGLWISERIVHKHRGHLAVRSATGEPHGTVFRLWLPLQLAPTANGSWLDA